MKRHDFWNHNPYQKYCVMNRKYAQRYRVGGYLFALPIKVMV